MRSTLRAGLFSLAALAFTLLSKPADACIGLPACTSFAPEDVATLPASIAGFPVVGVDEDSIQIRNRDGALLKTTLTTDLGVSLLVPSEPLSAGTYTASWSRACSGATDHVTEITIVDAAPMPTETGAISVAGAERRKAYVGGNRPENSCLDELDVALVTIAIAPAPSLAPYLPIVAWETKVDGVASLRLPFARRDDFTRAVAEDLGTDGPLTTRLFAICDGELHNVSGVKPGTHDVEVRARLLGGAEIQATPRIRVRVSCAGKNGDVVDSNGPLEVEDVPTPTTTNTSDTESDDFDVNRHQGGCAASPVTAVGAVGWWLLACLGCVLLRRRSVSEFS